MNTVRVDDALEQALDRPVDLSQHIFVFLLLQALHQGTQHCVQPLVERCAGDPDECAKGSSIEGGDGLCDERRNKDREDAVGSNLPSEMSYPPRDLLTDMTSCRACRAVSEPSPGLRIASNSVGMVWSIALAPM